MPLAVSLTSGPPASHRLRHTRLASLISARQPHTTSRDKSNKAKLVFGDSSSWPLHSKNYERKGVPFAALVGLYGLTRIMKYGRCNQTNHYTYQTIPSHVSCRPSLLAAQQKIARVVGPNLQKAGVRKHHYHRRLRPSGKGSKQVDCTHPQGNEDQCPSSPNIIRWPPAASSALIMTVASARLGNMWGA